MLRFVLMTEIVFKAPHRDKLLKMKVSLLHVPNRYSLCENARYSNYRETYKIYMKFHFGFYFCGKIWSSPWSWRRGLIWIKSFKSLSKLLGDFDLKSLICSSTMLRQQSDSLVLDTSSIQTPSVDWNCSANNFFLSNPFSFFLFNSAL